MLYQGINVTNIYTNKLRVFGRIESCTFSVTNGTLVMIINTSDYFLNMHAISICLLKKKKKKVLLKNKIINNLYPKHFQN